MARFDDNPKSLGDVLHALAGRMKRVDLRLIDEIRQMWPGVVAPPLSEHCRPEFIKDGVLVVSVPSGAFAERVRLDSSKILTGFSSLGERAPHTIRTVLEGS